jgi:hypothetical protein
MAFQAYTDVPGMTPEMYDGMMQQAGRQLTSSPGFIAHVVSPIEGGMGVTELWESREALEAFPSNVVAPTMQGAGMPMIQPQVRAIHNLVITGKG